jgi:Mlc titration factor MtfA (ptsG expression regulator)
MLQLLIFLHYETYKTGSIRMSSGEFLFWFSIPLAVVLIGIAVIYLQRYEIMVTRCFLYFKSLSPEQQQLLKGFKYYHSLKAEQQLKFEKRVQHFLVNKTFIAKEAPDVTEEMKILIAAACVQLTFGHRPFYLSHFKKISVYRWQPVNLENIKTNYELLIFWSEFQEGYVSPTDGYNPGMKILAMALMLEERLRTNSDKLFGDYAYRNWQQKSRALGERFIQTGLTPFRNYREVDKTEFFAVAVVYFFENPADFSQRFPDLFNAMKKLLGQDTLRFNYQS